MLMALTMVCLLVSCVEVEKVRTHNFKEQYVIEGKCEWDIYVNVFEVPKTSSATFVGLSIMTGLSSFFT